MSIFSRLDHVSIGVKDMEKARNLFCDILGGEPLADKGNSNDEGFDWFTFNLGGKKMELVSPHAGSDGGVGRYIEKHGEGFHHISISVENIDDTIAYLESKGVRVLGVNKESETFKHFYLHPKDTFGALIQVFEENEKTLDDAD